MCTLPSLVPPHVDPLTRGEVYERLDHLTTLRNRIAYHEPIHQPRVAKTNTDIVGLHGELVDVLSWMDSDVHAWVTRTSRAPDLFTAKP